METSSGDAQSRGASKREISQEKQEKDNQEQDERLFKKQEDTESAAGTAQIQSPKKDANKRLESEFPEADTAQEEESEGRSKSEELEADTAREERSTYRIPTQKEMFEIVEWEKAGRASRKEESKETMKTTKSQDNPETTGIRKVKKWADVQGRTFVEVALAGIKFTVPEDILKDQGKKGIGDIERENKNKPSKNRPGIDEEVLRMIREGKIKLVPGSNEMTQQEKDEFSKNNSNRTSRKMKMKKKKTARNIVRK